MKKESNKPSVQLSSRINELLEEIRSRHVGAKAKVTEAKAKQWDALQDAVACGAALLALKDEVTHGEFMPLANRELPDISESTRNNYMRVTKYLNEVGGFKNLKDVKNLKEAYETVGLIPSPQPRKALPAPQPESEPMKKTGQKPATTDAVLTPAGGGDPVVLRNAVVHTPVPDTQCYPPLPAAEAEAIERAAREAATNIKRNFPASKDAAGGVTDGPGSVLCVVERNVAEDRAKWLQTPEGRAHIVAQLDALMVDDWVRATDAGRQYVADVKAAALRLWQAEPKPAPVKDTGPLSPAALRKEVLALDKRLAEPVDKAGRKLLADTYGDLYGKHQRELENGGRRAVSVYTS